MTLRLAISFRGSLHRRILLAPRDPCASARSDAACLPIAQDKGTIGSEDQPMRPVHLLSLALVLATPPLASAQSEGPGVDLAAAREASARLGCDGPGTMAGDQAPDAFELTEPPEYEGGKERRYLIYEIVCTVGAYNVSSVYLVDDGYDGPVPAAFAEPRLQIEYEDEASERLRSVTVDGFGATFRLVNSQYDPETHSILSSSRWRGLGDASDSGRWRFQDGRFVLERFEVDPTYDGAIEPQVVFER